MFAISARYRGRATRRADYVNRSAELLSTVDGVAGFIVHDVEEIVSLVHTATATADTTTALLAAGDWAVAIAWASDSDTAVAGARKLTSGKVKPGSVVCALVERDPSMTEASSSTITVTSSKDHADCANVEAVFMLLGHILSKRTVEGRQATALMRSGVTQQQAADELEITKQAMSQRLLAAGWAAECAGWQLAINMLRVISRDNS